MGHDCHCKRKRPLDPHPRPRTPLEHWALVFSEPPVWAGPFKTSREARGFASVFRSNLTVCVMKFRHALHRCSMEPEEFLD